MAEEGKSKIQKFNGQNFGFWLMQIEDYLYQKDLYLPLGGIKEKPEKLSAGEWNVLDRKALGAIRLSLDSSVAFNIKSEKTTEDLMAALKRMYEKPSASNKVHLMKNLFNLKMSENGGVNNHLNEFNSITSQLTSVGITFDDEIQALLVLSSLPDSWNGMVTALSNSHGSKKLKYSDVVDSILDEEVRRKSSGESSSNGVALNMDNRGRGKTRDRDRNRGRSKSRRGKSRQHGQDNDKGDGCWHCGKTGHIRRNCKLLKNQPENNQGNNNNAVNVVNDNLQDALILSLDNRSESWVVDSGASFHATGNKDLLQNFVGGDLGKVYLGDDASCNIIGKGDVKINLVSGTVLQLKDVRLVPDLKRNLISVGQLAESGYMAAFTSDSWKIIKGAMVIARGRKEGSLYMTSGKNNLMSVASISSDTKTWHSRLGHMSEKGMKILHSQGKLSGLKSVDLELCENCVFGKQKRVSFARVGRPPKSEKLELVHTDVCGPTQVSSLGGSVYFVTFIDDCTRKLWVYFLKHKSEVFNVFKNWKALVENETGLKLKCLRSDNGGEYCSKEFEEYCSKNGIRREKTVPRTPQQNGVAERMNRTIMERARSMRLHAGLPLQLWADAVNTAVYLINRGPSVPLDGGIPEEAWTGKEVRLNHLRTFGCTSYVHIDPENRGKLDSKSKKCTFIGYGDSEFGYRLWDSEDRKIIRSRNVVFDERFVYKNRDQSKGNQEVDEFIDLDEIVEDSAPQLSDNNSEQEPKSPLVKTPIVKTPRVNTPILKTPQVLRRSERVSNEPDWYSPSMYYLLLTDSGEPESFKEALEVEDKGKWELAMNDEMDSLLSNETWDLADLPNGKKALHNKWVYRIKEEQNGSKRYKARLVVKGFQQVEGIDFTEIFAPVVKMSTIRSVLNIVAVDDLHLEQLDVKTAFLHGDLEEDIYMRQPQGYEISGSEHLVCKLKKSLYGLKQAPRQWYIKFEQFMSRNDYIRCNSDHCCFFKRFDNCYIILLLYVDDMLVAGSSMKEIANLKEQLSKEFSMKDLGAAKQILGMKIKRDRQEKVLKLSQADYVQKILKRFNMENSKSVSTPLAGHFKLSKDQCAKSAEDKRLMSRVPYSSAVGSLMYAMVCTRPDIAHAVGVVSRFMSNPGKAHWEAVKWILRYLRGTSDYTLCYGGSEIKLQGYVDSDLAGDLDGRKSTTGYVFTLGSAAVSWVSQLQKIVAISTTEAEYVAATEACKEMVWWKSLMSELGMEQESSILYSDSQSAIHLAKNSAFHKRTKHIDMKYHFIRSLLDDGIMSLEKIHTSENPADMFTKVVTMEKLSFCSTSIGLHD